MTSPNAPLASSGRKSIRQVRLWAGIAVLAVLSTVAVYRQLRLQHADGRGEDTDSGTDQLDAVMARTPSSERDATLIHTAETGLPGLRYAAVDALGAERGTRVADAIERAFTDSSAPVRLRAMEVLQNVDGRRGLHLLLVGLVDEDQWIRQFASQQLVLFCEKHPHAQSAAAVPTLIRALDDPDSVVRFMSVRALHRATGQPWIYRSTDNPSVARGVVEHWKTWWRQDRNRAAIPPYFASVEPVRPLRADAAPTFHIRDLDGNDITNATQRGRVTLVNFWGTWCPPCRVELPALIELDQADRARGLNVVGVAVGETDGAAGLRKWCADHRIGYRVALADSATQDAFGHVEEVPVSFLVDRAGKVRYRWEGERDLGTFRAAADRLLAEPAP